MYLGRCTLCGLGGLCLQLHAHRRDANEPELGECVAVESVGLDLRLVELGRLQGYHSKLPQ